MGKYLGALADRMVAAFVPQTTAGACPCNDCYYTRGGCSAAKCKRCCTNCNCTATTCSGCSYNGTYC